MEPEGPDKFGILQSSEEYDRNGNPLMEIACNSEGDIVDKNEYRYDGSGNVKETLIYGEDDDILERTVMERNPEGRLIRELVYYLDGSVDTRNFFYDQNGYLTGMEAVDDEDETEYSELYFYEGGKPIRIERHEDNEIIFSQDDQYENNTIRSRKVWSSEDEEPYTLITEYNSHGRRIKEIRYDSRDNITERNTWEEDENGRVCRVVEENRQRKNTTEISHDEKGNIIYQKEVNVHGEVNHEVYRTYDENGRISRVQVEAVQRNTGEKMAYTLFYVYDYFED
jgi:antitoxin component YwqK of YwqJK toxin-antitoxin module